ncbi:hypothetical protein BH10ACI1_BH10ACI1_03120 [soil metagenome]
MNEIEALLTAQNLKVAATMIILLAAIYSFVKEKIPAAFAMPIDYQTSLMIYGVGVSILSVMPGNGGFGERVLCVAQEIN